MLAIRLDEHLLKQVDKLAHNQHTNRSHIIRQAIIRFIEDSEDLELARYAQSKMRSSKSLKQVKNELGLDSKD